MTYISISGRRHQRLQTENQILRSTQALVQGDGNGTTLHCGQIEGNPSLTRNNNDVLLEGHLLHVTPQWREKARDLAQMAYRDYSAGTPRPSHIHVLTRLNVLDAMARNATALGFSVKGLCSDELVSPFNQAGPGLPWTGKLFSSCPESLRPTPIQRAIIHHPWIDLLPIPRLRDNILLAMRDGVLDDDELCGDLLSLDDGRGETASLIVWADSWDPRAWEASIPFLRKWGWLLSGCRELWVATSEWREKRGECRLR